MEIRLHIASSTAEQLIIVVEREGHPMKEQLQKQLEYVQERISEITVHEHIEIKQISDLQRYIEMEKNLIESLYLLGEV